MLLFQVREKCTRLDSSIAGGNANNFSGSGGSKINSSIGSQWKSRVSKLDDDINGQTASYLGITKLSGLGIKFMLI